MTTRLVTGTISDPATGQPWAGAEIKFALDTTGVTVVPPGVYPPKSVIVLTNAAGQLGVGNVGIPLWANEEGSSLTKWNVSIDKKYSFSFRLPAGGAPIDLAVLKVAGLITVEPGDPLITLIGQMILDAGLGGGGAWGEITGTLADQTDLQTALDAEATARGSADTAIQSSVTAEATARSSAVTAEATARGTADTALQTNITAEATARAAADLLLAPIASPALTGSPTAPTPANGDNSTKIPTTAFVKNAIDAVIAGAPGALDTLLEISNQLAADETAVGALTTTVSGKLAKASNLSDLTDAAAARGNIGVTSIISGLSAIYQAISAKLTAIAALVNAVGWLKNDGTGVFSYSTPSKTDVGLGSVDNISDAGKPVSTAQQTALDLKSNKAGDTFTGQLISSFASALSTAAVFITGAWIKTGGTGTTTKPHVLIEEAGAASTAWGTTGTGLGINANGGTPNLIDAQLSGASKFKVSSAGGISGVSLTITAGNTIGFASSTQWSAPVDGKLNVYNSGFSGLYSLSLGATAPTPIGVAPTHGQVLTILQGEELVTIAALATSTSLALLIPAGAIILAVSARTTVAIPTAATYTVKVGSQVFNTAGVGVAANSTDPGTAGGPFYNATAQQVTITPNLTPAANTGRVRLTVIYLLVTPATS